MLKVEAPGGAKEILLHACCAPCSGAVLECLRDSGIRPVVFFSNSNITPRGEYDLRLSELRRYAGVMGVEVVEDEYDHEAWLAAVHGLEREPERGRRCEACFRYRLGRAARYAASRGLPVLATTLASSRWKDLDQVNAAGLSACSASLRGIGQPAVHPHGESKDSDLFAESQKAPISFDPTTVVVPPLPSRGRHVPAGGAPRLTIDDAASVSPQVVVFWQQNWRKGGLQERRNEVIREQGFYNQTWCGCEFSRDQNHSN